MNQLINGASVQTLFTLLSKFKSITLLFALNFKKNCKVKCFLLQTTSVYMPLKIYLTT